MIEYQKNKKLSIIIPNYNYAQYISRTIESIITQKYTNIEIIIVDDGSTDNSFDIISMYKEKYPNMIKAIRQQNMGQAKSINNGFDLASGDILGWINSDDTYCENSLEKVMKVFNENAYIDIVYGNINVIDSNDNHIYSIKHFKFSYTMSVFSGFANNISSNAVFWRKELMNEVGLLNNDFKCGLDNEYFSRITWGRNIYQLKSPLANFQQQEITKAAIGHSNWEALMKRESDYVFDYSYNKLLVSRIIPTSQARKIRPFFILFRRLLKLATGRYF